MMDRSGDGCFGSGQTTLLRNLLQLSDGLLAREIIYQILPTVEYGVFALNNSYYQYPNLKPREAGSAAVACVWF